MEDCLQCSTDGRCEICKAPMIPTQQSLVCRDKIENCMNDMYDFNNNFDIVCTECAPGYFITEEGDCEECIDSPFLNGCSECDNAFICSKCIAGIPEK